MLEENNEYIEVYIFEKDGNRKKLPEIAKRETNVGEGKFVIGVNNWIVNSQGEFLVQKRSRNKRNNPNKWSSTNGLRKIGEDSIDTCIRETQEELGVNVSNTKIKFMGSKVAGENLIVDIFLTIINLNINDITIQTEEVEEIRWVSPEELLKLDISTTCSYIRTCIKDFNNENEAEIEM